jgi:hypothetical protein
MKKYILLVITSSLILLPVNILAQENVSFNKEMQHHSNSEHHDHGTFMIPKGELIPSVKLIVHNDSKKGWNLEVKITNFSFAPEKINQESKFNEGHAHIYINGKKLTRLYSNWYYLEDLPKGKNEIKISLNTNNHETLVSGGKMIEDTVIITVP